MLFLRNNLSGRTVESAKLLVHLRILGIIVLAHAAFIGFDPVARV